MSSKNPSSASSPGRYRRVPTPGGSPNTSPQPPRSDSSLKSIVSAAMRGTMEIFLSGLSLVPNFVWFWVALLVLFFVVIGAFKSAMDRPTVYESYHTKECVRAEDAKGRPIPCAEAGEDYHHVWVY
jgi:hypothetical protein